MQRLIQANAHVTACDHTVSGPHGRIQLFKVLKLQISLHCHMLHARIFLLSCVIMQFCLTHFEGSRVWTVGLASCMMAKLHVRDTELSDWS